MSRRVDHWLKVSQEVAEIQPGGDKDPGEQVKARAGVELTKLIVYVLDTLIPAGWIIQIQ